MKEKGKKKLEIRSPFLLLGEGSDENAVFKKLIELLKIDHVQVLDYGGRDNCANFLSALAVTSDPVERVLVTRDADESTEQALQSVQDAIARAQFRSTVSVESFIISGHNGIGALEDLFLIQIAHEDAPSLECINQMFACAGIAKPLAKARLHAWLALQKEPWKASPIALSVETPNFDDLRAKLSAFFARM